MSKKKITESQARSMVVATGRSQLGYTGTPWVSKYGIGRNWPGGGSWVWQGLWCARGVSWFYAEAFGIEAAKAGIGRQPSTPLPAGWAATWLWRDWLRGRGLHVGFANAKPGDIIFYRYPNPSGGRGKNPTNHVSLVAANRGNYLECIGPNTPKPGAGGDPTAGAGVWLHKRYLTSVVVAVYRADWSALVRTYNAGIVGDDIGGGVEDLTEIHRMLRALGYAATTAGIKKYQKDRGLTSDGIPGKITTAALEEDVSTIKNVSADIKNLSKLIVERTTVQISESTGKLLHTNHRGARPLGWVVGVLANRIGRIDGWVLELRAEVSGLTEAVKEISVAQGMNRAQVDKLITDKINSSRVTVAENDED